MRTALRFSWWLNLAAAMPLILGAGLSRAQTISPEAALAAGPIAGASEAGEGIRLNFRDAPLDAVLDYLSEARRFIIVRKPPSRGG